MDVLEKTRILGKAGHFDSCGPKACEVNVNKGLEGIYNAKAEHKTCRIFKTLMDNSCSFDCKYCNNSSSSNCKKKKASYEPEELAKIFNYLRKNLAVDGLFLSSGVTKDPDISTEKMLQVVKLLRYKYNFQGYLHFKVLPGTSYSLIKEASELATRMSINIEAPNKGVMDELSSCKDYNVDILRRQSWISKMNLSGGQSTQMILNKLSTDKDVLKMVDWEYNALDMRRMYFASFQPVKGTPLENELPEHMSREAHLYNIDFLVRNYNYNFKEFNQVMTDSDMLPNEDPKLALAKATFEGPVDINESNYDELIRVPGIGPETAKKILSGPKINKYEQLYKLGGWIKRAKPFIKVNGHWQKRLVDF